MKPVDIVKIEKLIPIYKNGEEALNIQVAHICDSDGNSCEFDIVVGKGLYKIGDNVLYIMPDFCIPNSLIFREYHEPNGDISKNKLGKKGRIRSIKFNFSMLNSTEPIYSNGIIIPLTILKEYLKTNDFSDIDLRVKLEVIKYVAEDSFESGGSGLSDGDIPSFLYKTDEPLAQLKKSNIDRCFEDNEIISGSIKRDGSSITEYFRKDSININEFEKGICSRNQKKKIEQTYVSSYIDLDNNILHQYFDRATNQKGWYNDFKQKFYTNQDVVDLNLKEITTEVRDAFVDTTKKHGYLDKLETYCLKYNVELALRGELVGGSGGSKGSGKNLNQDAKGDSKVIFFGVDDLKSGCAKRIHYGQEHNLKKVSEELGLEYTEPIFEGIYSYDDLIKKCNEIFKEIKEKTGQIIEGIVVRSKFSNNLSVKILNFEYDSKK